MAQRPEYIQLETNDDVAHVRDRLSFIRGRRVLLIWPEEGTALTRKLDLVLIQREAKRRVIQLACVTHDPVVTQHAKELGISVFETVNDSESNRWQRGRTKIFTQRHHKPEDELTPQELLPVASRVRNNRRTLPAWQMFILRVAIVILLLTVVAFTAYVIVPSATIVIKLAPQQLSTNTTILADPNVNDIDVENRVIPATTLRAEVQTVSTLSTTGVTPLNNRVAIGVVVFTNQTDDIVEIPANTNVSTSAGTPIIFKTTKSVTLNGGVGQTTEAPIEALQGASEGNVETSMINTIIGPLEDRADVRNLSPTTGGESRALASVTADDRERLLAIVRGQLQAIAYDEMQTTLTDTQIIVIETIRIAEERNDWTVFSHAIGDVTDTLTLTMRAKVTALVIDDRFSRQIVFAQLSLQKPVGQVIQADTFTYARGAVSDITPDSRMTFSASGDVQTVTQVNTTNIGASIAGQSISDAIALIQTQNRLSNRDQVLITLTPDWMTSLPLLPLRITVITEVQP